MTGEAIFTPNTRSDIVLQQGGVNLPLSWVKLHLGLRGFAFCIPFLKTNSRIFYVYYLTGDERNNRKWKWWKYVFTQAQVGLPWGFARNRFNISVLFLCIRSHIQPLSGLDSLNCEIFKETYVIIENISFSADMQTGVQVKEKMQTP